MCFLFLHAYSQIKNIATGKMSPAITPVHFFDNFNFFCFYQYITKLLSSVGILTHQGQMSKVCICSLTRSPTYSLLGRHVRVSSSVYFPSSLFLRAGDTPPKKGSPHYCLSLSPGHCLVASKDFLPQFSHIY